MYYTHNFFSMLLMIFYTFLIILFLIIKAIKDFKKIVFVNCFDFNLVNEVIHFFVAFFCVEIKIFVDFFLNNKLVNFLIIIKINIKSSYISVYK